MLSRDVPCSPNCRLPRVIAREPPLHAHDVAGKLASWYRSTFRSAACRILPSRVIAAGGGILVLSKCFRSAHGLPLCSHPPALVLVHQLCCWHCIAQSPCLSYPSHISQSYTSQRCPCNHKSRTEPGPLCCVPMLFLHEVYIEKTHHSTDSYARLTILLIP